MNISKQIRVTRVAGIFFASAWAGLFTPQALALAVPAGVHTTTTAGNVLFNIDNVEMFGNGAAPITVGLPSYVGGPCGTAGGATTSLYACAFKDQVNNVATPYAWETAIQNPLGQGVLTAKVGFFYPFGGPLLGTITLGEKSTFHVGIIVNDNDALIGDTGNRNIWYSWKKPGQNILTSAAVIEGNHNVLYTFPVAGVAKNHGDFWYHFHTDPMDSFVVDPTLNVNDLDYTFMDPSQQALAMEITPVPEADTWAMMGAGLGMIGAVAYRRKRRLV